MHYVQCPHCQASLPHHRTDQVVQARCRRCGRIFNTAGDNQGRPMAAPVTGADLARGRRCAMCGCILSIHQVARHTCDSPQCKRTYLRQSARQSREKEAARLREKAEGALRSIEAGGPILESLGGPPEGYPLAILPANTWPLAPLPNERRSTLAENLRAIIQRALADPVPADGNDSPLTQGPSDPADETEPGELAILGSACATCRGWCCQGGGEHAYLDETSMRSYWGEYPDKDADQILTDFLSYVPEVSYEGSCIYHTDSGCALPPEMRSEVSRSFYCEGLREFRRQLPRQGPRVGFAAATEEGEIVRMARIDEVQARPMGGCGGR